MKNLNFIIIAVTFALVSHFSVLISLGQKAEFTPQPFANKQSIPAVTIVVEGQPKNVAEVLKQKIEKTSGVKGKGYKGDYDVFAQARVADISVGNVFDIYTHVERAAKGDEMHSRITLFLSLGNESNFITADKYATEIANAQKMLENMIREIRVYELGLAIAAQTKIIGQEEGKQKDLEKKQASLEKERDGIIADLAETATGQVNQKAAIEAEKKKLLDLQTALQAANAGTAPAPVAPGGK